MAMPSGAKAIRVVIADDHEVVRQGLRGIIETQAGWTVVAEAHDGRDALARAHEHRPDVVVMDVAMPGLNGVDATRLIRSELPSTRVLILTMHQAEHIVDEALDAGANGFLFKADAGREIINAVNALLHDRPYFTGPVARMILEGYLRGKGDTPTQRLSVREREILQLLAEGHTTKEVADRLKLSVKTGETHRANLMKKIGARSTAGLVRYAIRNGIIQP
jgi:DNA-binding NarL/FixJ family response regulator